MTFSSTVGLKVTRAFLFGLGGTDIKSISSSASSDLRIVPESVARRRSGLLGLVMGAEAAAEGRALETRDTIARPRLLVKLEKRCCYHGSVKRCFGVGEIAGRGVVWVVLW